MYNFIVKAKTMKNYFLLLLSLIIFGCGQPPKFKEDLPPENDWNQRISKINVADSTLTKGSSYLPVYSEIYQRNKNYTFPLTSTVSIRNISITDTIFILKADYYNTHGDLITSYFKKPIYVKPMETIEIVVSEGDKGGGTGANFVFDWAKRKDKLDPFFEAVMISTTGQQGLSFTTQGIRKK